MFLQIRTVFNILGPMLNPAQAPYSLIGVANKDMLPLMANSFLVSKAILENICKTSLSFLECSMHFFSLFLFEKLNIQ